MARRKFTAEFKAKLVIEALKEERQIGEIANDYGVNPNLLRNWKKDFEANAARVFNESDRERKAESKVKAMRGKQEELFKTVGQLTFERDWLKKSVELFGEDYEKMYGPKPGEGEG